MAEVIPSQHFIYKNYKFCSSAICLAILGAVHRLGNNTRDTGTAVTTMNDCNAEIPPEPIEIKRAAITPIANPQNTLIELCGLSLPVITMEIA